eukprot:CAMPEP_0172306770 /NCGR_PEP_ID=MMETSP1058-20130122/7772_1 /TAXON_ID=83371 /ORGANISM="Detonula confervacea, Strain CCMP 353" /LENGTH=397 /DNA_ID=CAMNT_0013018755 /DNA_START=62 /DNA_END=1255 /DNA_ORIENTATION=+
MMRDNETIMLATEEHANAQRDEIAAMTAIFLDDFTLLSHDPISYSIQLRPDFGAIDQLEDGALRPPDDLALTVTYHPNYPDSTPIFGLVYDKNKVSLHHVQERALLRTVTTTAQAEIGMPSAYSCINAAQEFLEHGGLAQASVALLSDDCLAHILAYLATSKEEIDEVRVALPIFGTASKTNAVWKQLCRLRWREKWGFAKRWERALENFQTQYNQHFWMQSYHNEEEAAKMNFLTRDELSTMTFDYRQWFSFTLFHNQPQNMRDVLPTGLRDSLAKDVVFSSTGAMFSQRDWFRRLAWKSNNDDGAITQVSLKLTSNGSLVEIFTVYRLLNWGWEIRGSDSILRAVDEEGDTNLWKDYTTQIVVQDKPEWVEQHRSSYPYYFREIPDDEDCKALDW